jgi:hypothetical protein
MSPVALHQQHTALLHDPKDLRLDDRTLWPPQQPALHHQHAAVLHGPKDLRIDDRALWPPQQGQAQVAIVSTGLCGSDRMFTSR